MCIRDSCHPFFTGKQRLVDSAGRIERFTKKFAKRAGATACLLYTSDAADERSSVDLGGRRIIKKKKRERLQGVIM